MNNESSVDDARILRRGRQLRQLAYGKARPWVMLVAGLVLDGVGLWLVAAHSLWQPAAGSDLALDHEAAQAWRAGQSMYSGYAAHPPFAVLLCWPLTLVSGRSAYLLWTVASVCMFVVCITYTLHSLDVHISAYWVPMLIAAPLCWYPFLAHVALGQWSVLLLALFVAGWGNLRRGRCRVAGVLFGLAAAVKLFPAIVGLSLLLRRRWAALGVMALVTAVCSLLPMLVVPQDDYLTYVYEVVPRNASRFAAFPTNVSFTGVVSRVLAPGPWVQPVVDAPVTARVCIAVLSIAFVWHLSKRIYRLPETQMGDDLALAYACLAMLLLSPISWQHAFALLVLPFGIMAQAYQANGSRQSLSYARVAFTLLSLPDVLLARALMELYLPHRMPWYVAALMAAPTVGLLLLYFALGDIGNRSSSGGADFRFAAREATPESSGSSKRSDMSDIGRCLDGKTYAW